MKEKTIQVIQNLTALRRYVAKLDIDMILILKTKTKYNIFNVNTTNVKDIGS